MKMQSGMVNDDRFDKQKIFMQKKLKCINIIVCIFLVASQFISQHSSPSTKNYYLPDEIFKKTLQNISFISPIKINDDSGQAFQVQPSIAVDRNGVLYAVWMDYRLGTPDIFFSKSMDGGFTWSQNKAINKNLTDRQYDPTIAVDGNGIIYVAWADWRYYPHPKVIFFSKSIDGGENWTEIRVTHYPCSPYGLKIAIDEQVTGNIYLVWDDTRNLNHDIYFARSTDGGLTWEPDVKVNDDNLPDNDQTYPTIAVNKSGTIFIAWNDERGGFLWLFILLYGLRCILLAEHLDIAVPCWEYSLCSPFDRHPICVRRLLYS